MITANIHEAKTNLSQLIKASLSGKNVIIAKSGKPVVKLIPYTSTKTFRKPGILKGKIQVPDDFNNESSEINEMFYGKISA